MSADEEMVRRIVAAALRSEEGPAGARDADIVAAALVLRDVHAVVGFQRVADTTGRSLQWVRRRVAECERAERDRRERSARALAGVPVLTPAPPDPLAIERARVVRRFQRYTAEQRASRAASHRLGPRQRHAVGESFYTHPDVPRAAFDSKDRAARAGLAAVQAAAEVVELDGDVRVGDGVTVDGWMVGPSGVAHSFPDAVQLRSDCRSQDRSTLVRGAVGGDPACGRCRFERARRERESAAAS